ncbi:MAG: toll/interleukin-1 receptor domain-containing protein [Lachnospiraceae bacterium]|nr:toll/interleukin-1 receptor domain-containing protein [Lachnospiraceae bacterium]
MSDHYNAFISYKHASEDNRVAEAIHKGLEHYHIPRKIQKKKGMKRISRIFRDKDELPITSDLSDNIANALAASDYLIVICSTNTKQSAWVPREIECFLKNHTKREIFTVLVDGEPCEVIPEILLYDEQTVTDENGNEQVVRVPIEPLSCDYRMPLKKAKKLELPRLASGLIGCAYDELMNRHRQYRMKQLTAVFAVILTILLGFSAYMYDSRTKIHKNYQESLKNQSRYLANESENLLEKEQRISALQLALEALPKDEKDDRPVTAEAVKALTDATLAYVGDSGNNINAAWNYTMPNVVSDFEVSSDGNYIAILDSGNVLGVWNTKTHEKILDLEDMPDPVEGMKFLKDSHFLLWSSHTLNCYDMDTARTSWKYTIEDDMFQDSDSFMCTDTTVYFGTVYNKFLEFDPLSGKVKKEIGLPVKDGYKEFDVLESKLSPDGKKIAFRGLEDYGIYAFGILDLASNDLKMSELMEKQVKDIEWIDNDTLMTASNVLDMKGSMSYGSMDLLSTDHVTLQCINVSDLTEKWTQDFVCNGVTIKSGFERLGDASVAYYSGNVIAVYDPLTGKEKYRNNVNDSVLDVSDKDGDGKPNYITQSGGMATPAPDVDEDAVYYKKYFADELRQIVISNGVYARQHHGSEVIYYGLNVYDDAWTAIAENTLMNDSIKESSLTDDHLAVLTDEEDGPALYLFGMERNTSAVPYRLTGERAYKYKILGEYKDRIYLGYDDGQKFHLIIADAWENELQDEALFEAVAKLENTCSLKSGKLIYSYHNDEDQDILAIKDLDTEKSIQTELTERIGYAEHVPVYYEEENAVYIKGENEYVWDVDGQKVNGVDMPEGWTGACCFSQNSAEGIFAVSDGKTILLKNKQGKTLNTIRCPGVMPIGMVFAEDVLMVLYSDGGFCYYDRNSGEFRKKTDLSVYYNFDGTAVFDFDEEHSLFTVQMDRLTDVVDLESGVETACIMNCFGHDKKRDTFVTCAKGENQKLKAGYYKRYTVNELIEKANKILENTELSDEMKSRYGIE